ncbi:MAG: hypothetical protein ACT4PJ_14375 [Gemmatimonadaceae bacterium]
MRRALTHGAREGEELGRRGVTAERRHGFGGGAVECRECDLSSIDDTVIVARRRRVEPGECRDVRRPRLLHVERWAELRWRR